MDRVELSFAIMLLGAEWLILDAIEPIVTQLPASIAISAAVFLHVCAGVAAILFTQLLFPEEVE